MSLGLAPFDATEFITDDQSARWFLESAIEDGQVIDLVHALRTVVHARTPEYVAKAVNMSVADLDLVLANDQHPDMTAIVKILAGLGLRLRAEPIEPETDAA